MDLFVEYNIPADPYLPCEWVPKTVCLLWGAVSDEKICDAFRIELFSFRLWHVNVRSESEDAKVGDIAQKVLKKGGFCLSPQG